MKEETFDYNKSLYAMIIKYIDGLSFLDEKGKSILLQISLYFKKDMKHLYEIYDAVMEDKDEFKLKDDGLEYKKDDFNNVITFRGEKIVLSKDQFKSCFSTIIDFMEDILPLGTVVKLKNEFTDGIKGAVKDKDRCYFIIMKRFLGSKDSKYYFTYGLEPYPIGDMENGRMLYCTSQLIDRVIYKGFSDEEEHAYICVIKNEMIIKKNIHSISFASKDEKQKFIEEMNEQK